MEPNDQPQAFDKLLSQMAIAGLLVLCVVVGFYFWRFHGGLSDSQGTWGEFGDFVGGTVNPILGFMSLLVLLKSLQIQRRVLFEARQSALLEEFQRIIASSRAALDQSLAADFVHPNFPTYPGKQDVYGACLQLASSRRELPKGLAVAFRNDHAFARVQILMLHFAHLLDDFVEEGGSEKIAYLYTAGLAAPIVVYAALQEGDERSKYLRYLRASNWADEAKALSSRFEATGR